MDLEKLLKIASTYLTQYVHDFIRTLQAPWPRAYRASDSILAADGVTIMAASSQSDPSEVLSANVRIFVFLSIFVGSTLLGLASRIKGPDFQIIVVYVAVSWLAFSTYAFLLAKYVLRGTADFSSSARATLYCLGVTYVIASFVFLLGSFAPPTVVNGTVWIRGEQYNSI